MEFGILGPLEVRSECGTVALGGIKPRAVLAVLLLHPNQPVHAERLALAVWGQDAPARAVQTVQVYVSRLRKALGDAEILATTPAGYCLRVRPDELDAERFARLVDDGLSALDAGQAGRAAATLREALALWRGPPLAELAFERFAQAEIARLEEQRLTALEARVDCELQLGEHSRVVGELRQLVAAHPGRERLAEQLMLALYRCGRQGEALEVYARTRAHLSGELGLEPGRVLQTLQAEILAQAPALDAVPDETRSAPSVGPVTAQTGVLPTGVLTFVLTDVEGSTELWEADSDATATALELHDGLIARLVEHHGGRLLKDQGEGDATLSVFQRASDAVACAAGLQRDLATVSWPEFDMRVRIAVHSGEAQERDGDYFGPVLNRAARLRALATGGVTVVSQTTTELVRDRLPPELELVDLGRHELRGISRPERVFELRTAVSVSSGGSAAAAEPIRLGLPRSLQAVANSAFVGREVELAHLHERWEQIRGGTRSAIVIGGEPGIGKTRLASELAQAVHEEGALVLYGRCDEGLAVPYQPFVEALRPYAKRAGLNRLRAELGDMAPELGRLLPELSGLGEPVRADPESERFALFEAVAALIEAMTREQRALLVLDDLHWAANPTLLMLRHLIRCERPLGALLLGTYRETELETGHQLAQLLADLHCDASAVRMSIRGLSERDIAVLVEEALGHAPDERPQLVCVLGAQTAGNPFFIRELLAHLADTDERVHAGDTAPRLHAPEGLRDVIGQRVARLSAPAKRALSVAAVAGAAFSFVLLERVLCAPSDVLDALDEAVAAGLLVETGRGDYAFAHALVRQTIYEQLGAARRIRFHRQLGEALEALDDAHADVEALAHHFTQAAADGQGAKGAAYALAAGRSATGRLGHVEAAAHYERGLHALTRTGQPHNGQRCALLLALGEARWNAGELDKARQAYERAAELTELLDDAPGLAQAALGFCGPHLLELDTALTLPVADLLQRALTVLGDDDSALRARLMGRLAATLTYADVEQRRPLLARQALEIARRLSDKAALADVLASTYWATRGPDTMHECMGLAEELRRTADDIGDGRLRLLAHAWLLDHLLELGDIDAVERELDVLKCLAKTRKERYFTWLLTVYRANHAHLKGRLEQFETLAQAALTHRFEGHDEPADRIFGVQTLFARGAQGRLDEFADAVESFAAQYPQVPIYRCVLAHIYAHSNRGEQARQELEALARADFCDIPRDVNWLPALSTLCGVVVVLDDISRAQVLYKLLLPYADRYVVPFALLCDGSVSRPLGLLATKLSRYEEAEHHFEQALKMNAQIRAPLLIASTQHQYAHMLLRRGRLADRGKALELLTEALATAEQLGLSGLADQARRLKLSAEAAGAAPALPRPA